MFCETCGQKLSADITQCPGCGAVVSDRQQENVIPPPVEEQSEQEGFKYAGFWWRIPAIVIDFIIIQLFIGLPMGFFFGIFAAAQGMPPEEIEKIAIGLQWMLGVPLIWLYFAIFEASAIMGTPGKRIVGLKVTDLDGNRIRFNRAGWRYWSRWLTIAAGFAVLIIFSFVMGLDSLGKFLAIIVAALGYLMALWTPKKQALHDIIARALVLKI